MLSFTRCQGVANGNALQVGKNADVRPPTRRPVCKGKWALAACHPAEVGGESGESRGEIRQTRTSVTPILVPLCRKEPAKVWSSHVHQKKGPAVPPRGCWDPQGSDQPRRPQRVQLSVTAGVAGGQAPPSHQGECSPEVLTTSSIFPAWRTESQINSIREKLLHPQQSGTAAEDKPRQICLKDTFVFSQGPTDRRSLQHWL